MLVAGYIRNSLTLTRARKYVTSWAEVMNLHECIANSLKMFCCEVRHSRGIFPVGLRSFQNALGVKLHLSSVTK